MKFLRGGIFALSVFVLNFICCVNVWAQADDRALDGVYIDSVNISGMNEEEAMAAVQAELTDRMDDQITFTMENYSFALPVSDMGYEWTGCEEVVQSAVSYGKSGNIISKYKIEKDLQNESKVFPLDTTIDSAAMEAILEDAADRYNTPFQDMSLTHEEDGSFTIVEGVPGLQLNVGASANKIMLYMKNEWHGGDGTIGLVEERQNPGGDADALAQVQDLLGTAYTEYGESAASRAANVVNGAEKINGAILYPGETFSFLDATLPFTEENGYQKGKSYESGRVVESIGGGVCQVSSTLYIALIRAEIQIDQRYNHSMQVSYVSPSMDAAVAEYAKDLIFTNNLDYPIYIEAKTDGWSLTISVYGKETRDPDRTVDYEYEILDNSDPEVDIDAILWKVVNENGEETRTEFNRSTYYLPKTEEETSQEATSEEEN
ncbi:MAG: VanW family protein [Lachnospiraceae bacterium]|nr:VanW family protein [Lachnospiraceae bacterium]